MQNKLFLALVGMMMTAEIAQADMISHSTMQLAVATSETNDAQMIQAAAQHSDAKINPMPTKHKPGKPGHKVGKETNAFENTKEEGEEKRIPWTETTDPKSNPKDAFPSKASKDQLKKGKKVDAKQATCNAFRCTAG